MMIQKLGNIFEDNAEALVNTVNCVGVMGRGIALQCKKMYPDNFKMYEQACKRGEVVPGKMFVSKTGNLTNPRYIINFPTKRHWRSPSQLYDIDTGLHALVQVIRDMCISSIAIPPLGCGNGGLHWPDVLDLLTKHLSCLQDVQIHLYAPSDQPYPVVAPLHKKPIMTSGRAALINLMQHYLDGLLDPFISLLEVHKLLYFLQEAGQPLRLNYVKYTYGPYAVNLKQILNRIEGYFIKGYNDGGDNPRKLLEIMPGALEAAQPFIRNDCSLQTRMNRVFSLIDGFEAPSGMELLATVHWTVVKEHIVSFPEIVKHIYQWHPHKREFDEHQIWQAYNRLLVNNWLIV